VGDGSGCGFVVEIQRVVVGVSGSCEFGCGWTVRVQVVDL
jgi:hypothetical protein